MILKKIAQSNKLLSQKKKFRNKLSSLLPILLLIVLPFLFFNGIFQGQSIITGSLSGSDLLDLQYPYRYILSEHLKNGTIPLWEPNLGTGFPILAEGQTGIFFIPNLLLALLPLPLSMDLSLIMVFILAGLSMYWYLSVKNFAKPAALFGSIIFAFSAFFTTRYQHLNLINAACLFPGLLAATEAYLKKCQGRYLIINGIIISQILLAGHPQMAFYCFLIYLLYCFGLTLISVSKNRSNLFSLILLLSVSFLIGSGLAAIQLIPTAELAMLSQRSEFNKTTLTAYPYDPSNFITLIAPYVFGNPAIGSYKVSIQFQGLFWENAMYVGLIPLILSLMAIIKFITKKEKEYFLWLIIAVLIISVLLVLGRFTPLFSALVDVIPLFPLFRFPTRFNLFVIFALAYLAAYELNKIFIYKKKKTNNQLLSTNDISQNNKSRFWLYSIIFLATLDLFLFSNQFTGYLKSKDILDKPPLIKDLDNSIPFRIYSLTQYGESPYQVMGWKNSTETLLNSRKTLSPNNNVYWGINSFTDRGWFEGGLTPKSRYELEDYLTKESINNPTIFGKVLGMYNVRYLVSFSENLGIEINKKNVYDLGQSYSTKLNLFENAQSLPLVYYTPEAKIINNKDEFKEAIEDHNFLPNKTVLLSIRPKEMSEQYSGIMDEFIKNNPLSISKYEDTKINISAEIKDHGFLVLSDLMYPGWKAYVDNKEQAILTANYISRAVELWPGKHEVIFKYEPLSFKVGAIISLSTLLILIGVSLSQIIKINKLKK